MEAEKSELPFEIWMMIMKYLPVGDLAQIQRVSCSLRNIALTMTDNYKDRWLASDIVGNFDSKFCYQQLSRYRPGIILKREHLKHNLICLTFREELKTEDETTDEILKLQQVSKLCHEIRTENRDITKFIERTTKWVDSRYPVLKCQTYMVFFWATPLPKDPHGWLIPSVHTKIHFEDGFISSIGRGSPIRIIHKALAIVKGIGPAEVYKDIQLAKLQTPMMLEREKYKLNMSLSVLPIRLTDKDIGKNYSTLLPQNADDYLFINDRSDVNELFKYLAKYGFRYYG